MKSILVAALSLLAVVPVSAEPETHPITYTWIATACDSWNCAASALILADGDPHVFVLPTSSSTHRWVVLRRVVEGSVLVPPDTPFLVEPFEVIANAVARYSAIDETHCPILVTPPGGKGLVVFLRDGAATRTRAVRP